MRIEVPARLQPLVTWGRAVTEDFSRNRASLAAGGLAYFVTLSLAPLAIAFGSLAGLVLGPDEVAAALDRLLAKAPDPVAASTQQVSDALISLVSGASAASSSVATVAGFVVALYAASKVVYGVRLALDTAFEAQSVRAGIVGRILASLFTLGALVVAVLVVVLITVVPRVLQWLGLADFRLSTGSALGDWIIVLAAVYLAVRGILAFGPNRRARVPWLSPGALVATLGIVGSTAFVGIYVHYSSTMSAAILALGAPVVLLLWLYLGFLGLLLGATMVARAERGSGWPSLVRRRGPAVESGANSGGVPEQQ